MYNFAINQSTLTEMKLK